MNRVIIVGSPRSNGRSAHLAEMLFEACIDECPEDELYLVPVSELDIAPCVGCNACRASATTGAGAGAAGAGAGAVGAAVGADAGDAAGEGAADHVGAVAGVTGGVGAGVGAAGADAGEGADVIGAGVVEGVATDAAHEGAADSAGVGGDMARGAVVGEGEGEGTESAVDAEFPGPFCPRHDDDMRDVYDLLPFADELTVVSPVYFSGAPSSLTALLDRLQPYFWQWSAQRAAGQIPEKRPAVLHVIGEGGDPNGYLPLVGKVRSALAVAGFELERVVDWVGKIDEDGEIFAEADEYDLPRLGVPLAVMNEAGGGSAPRSNAGSASASASASANAGDAAGERPVSAPATSTGKPRPKLDLSSGKGGNKPAGKSSNGGGSASRNSGRPSGSSARGGQRNSSKGASKGAQKGGAKNASKNAPKGAKNAPRKNGGSSGKRR